MCKILICLIVLVKLINCRQIIESEDQKLDQLERNDSPIIGVLAQEISYHLNTKYPGVYTSYIAASYIKFVEGGGARAVPIW